MQASLAAIGFLAQSMVSYAADEMLAQTDALAEQVAALVARIHPASAQHYGRLMIEDLTEKPPATPHGTEVAASER